METKTSIDYDRTFERLCNTYRSADKDKAITAHRSETIQFLTAHIDIDIQRKIDSLQNPNRCILLVGKDENLAKGIASYIYLTKGMKFFEAVNCSGIDDETMRRRFLGNGQSLSFLPVKLYIEEMQSSEEPPFSITIKKRDSLLENNVFHWFCLGHTLFLWNLDLNGKDHSLVKPLAMKIDDICKCKEHGMLIVSTATEDLPEYFTRLFDGEVINLEAKKQGISDSTPASTPKDTPARQDVSPMQSGVWSVSDNKQEVCWSGKTVTKLSHIPYKLFTCLLKKKGKFVNTKTLEKCWDKKPGYEKFLVDKMNDLKATLKNKLTEKGIKIQGEIIESKKTVKRKITAYKLPS